MFGFHVEVYLTHHIARHRSTVNIQCGCEFPLFHHNATRHAVNVPIPRTACNLCADDMALLINVSHQHHVSFIRDTLILDMLKMEYSRRLSYSDAFQLLRRLFLRTRDRCCRHSQKEHCKNCPHPYLHCQPLCLRHLILRAGFILKYTGHCIFDSIGCPFMSLAGSNFHCFSTMRRARRS